jgi:glycyl-tRNA synthetase beta chain
LPKACSTASARAICSKQAPPLRLSPRRAAWARWSPACAAPRRTASNARRLPLTVALDANGAPTAPLGKKLAALAKSVGVAEIDWQTLERASDGKADAFFYRYTARGATLADGLQAALDDADQAADPEGDELPAPGRHHRAFRASGTQPDRAVRRGVVPVSVLGLQASNSRRATASCRRARSRSPRGRVRRPAGIARPRRRQLRRPPRAHPHALLKEAGADKVIMPDSLLDE